MSRVRTARAPPALLNPHMSGNRVKQGAVIKMIIIHEAPSQNSVRRACYGL
jgi:hypothetical protein